MRQSTTILVSIAAMLSLASCSSGSGGASQCKGGAACTPANVCHVGIQTCQGGALVCSDTSSGVVDGIACGSGQVCRAGACIAACVAGQSCTPAPAANPCKLYATACNALGTVTSCPAVQDRPDRTSCGTLLVCSAGSCVPSIRTVSGTFQTTYWPDDGTRTTLPSPPPNQQTAAAILVPDGTDAGYTSLPIALDGNQGFSIEDVPAGPYFLQLDTEIFPLCPGCPTGFERAISTLLIELRADSPDLTSLSAARPDIVHSTSTNFVHLNVSGLAPWVAGDNVLTATSQGFAYGRLSPSPTPAAGATAAGGLWLEFNRGLPEASKGDVFYAYQRSATPVGAGSTAGRLGAASKYARITDLTLTPATTSFSVALTDTAPQTGAVRADFRYSQFAALASSVHPSAVPGTGAAIAVLAVPHSTAYPDLPSDFERTSLLLLTISSPPPATDFDYGTLHYGEFLDPLWKTYRVTVYAFDLRTTIYAGGPAGAATASFVSRTTPSSDPGPIVPVLGPPTQPRIAGRDAFAEQNSVGLQPTITWSAPTLGEATSYQVTIAGQTQPVIAGETRVLSAIVYSGRSFKVPPGFLKEGHAYSATITARSGPWDTFDHPPFLQGVPFHLADCSTGLFRP